MEFLCRFRQSAECQFQQEETMWQYFSVIFFVKLLGVLYFEDIFWKKVRNQNGFLFWSCQLLFWERRISRIWRALMFLTASIVLRDTGCVIFLAFVVVVVALSLSLFLFLFWKAYFLNLESMLKRLCVYLFQVFCPLDWRRVTFLMI